MHFRPYEPLGMTTSSWQNIPPIEIPIDFLIPSQQELHEGELPEGHSFSGDPYPHVVYHKGAFFISDGHNRIARMKKEGKISVQARLKFKI